jgi:flagellar hook-associated protein 1 FlgK
LEDQRQAAIAQLSQYIGLDQITTSLNGIDLTTSNGTPLVSSQVAYPLSTAVVSGTLQVYGGDGTNVTSGLTGGAIGGALEALTSTIPTIAGQIDTLAYSIATAVNTQNSAGLTASGTAAGNLFTIGTSSAGAAAAIGVATTDPNAVAAAGTGEGTTGNTNASALAALATTAIDGTQTASEAVSSTLAQIGEAAETATNDATVQQASLTQLTTQRDALSAVNLDTEASNLTEYQRSYQAASQVFSIVDTLLASAINLGVETAVS